MKALSSGAVIDIFQSLDSTSLEAKRRAAAGAKGPLWIVALRQTAGYGRRGSEWRQTDGDIAATFLFKPQAPADSVPQFSFVASLAVADAIRRYATSATFKLKWPNDVLVGGGKIAGLLLELIGTPMEPLIALGVGVNVVSAPEGLDYPTARLLDLCEAPPHPRAFIETLDEALCAWSGRWAREGFAGIRAEWLRRAAHLGRRIKVRLPAETVEGVFADLDLTGALILDCGGERRAITAGAVVFADGSR